MTRLGCIADDFTGASDAASFYALGGCSTALYNEVPDQIENTASDCLVVALKTRTEPCGDAMRHAWEAFRWLESQDVTQIYIKYCSTFDSTAEGNIGPIVDMMLEKLDCPYTILCPALPVNGRTVRDGDLYVNGVPLHESSMKDHPLTPMRDCHIPNLMGAQSKYPSFVVNDALLMGDEALLIQQIEQWTAQHPHFYLVPDCYLPHHLDRIVALFGHLPLLTGGSGLMTPLAQRNSQSAFVDRGVILAGSCSAATLEQIQVFAQSGGRIFQIPVLGLMDATKTAEDIWRSATQGHSDPVLLYTSQPPEELQRTQTLGRERVAAKIESTLAEIAQLAKASGVRRIIVAGGETSGAVTKALGFHSYCVGESVAPGVPILTPQQDDSFQLVLKSGNFGQPDFFLRALAMTEENTRLPSELETACWIAHSLFDRGHTTGATANLSFRCGNHIYMTASGSSFGRLTPDDFAKLDLEGNCVAGKKPSKETPLHLDFYRHAPHIGAIIHTHSTYSVLASTLNASDHDDCIPHYTPYLQMRLGQVALVPYLKPGSEELFQSFRSSLNEYDGYLLKQHGPVVGGKSLLEAFERLEELEESARIAWELR